MYYLPSVYKQEGIPVGKTVVYFCDTNPSGQQQSSIIPYCGRVRNAPPVTAEDGQNKLLVATFIDYKDCGVNGSTSLCSIPENNLLTPEDIALTFPDHFVNPTTDGDSIDGAPSPVVAKICQDSDFRRQLTLGYQAILGESMAISALRSR